MTIGKIGSLFISNGDNAQSNRGSAVPAASTVAGEQLEAKEKNSGQSNSVQSSDAVVVSRNMRDLDSSQIQEVVDPQRAARVSELKAKFENKTYQPNSQLVAASIFLELV